METRSTALASTTTDPTLRRSTMWPRNSCAFVMSRIAGNANAPFEITAALSSEHIDPQRRFVKTPSHAMEQKTTT
jgi:hypothetical protein